MATPIHDRKRARGLRMAERVAAGADPYEIAEEYGVSRSTVYLYCRKHDELFKSEGDAMPRHRSGMRRLRRHTFVPPKASIQRYLEILVALQQSPGNLAEAGRRCGLTRERMRQIADKVESVGLELWGHHGGEE